MNLLTVLFGTVVGIIIGALPGFTATMGIAILIPVTYTWNTATALIFLGAIYSGSMFGGSISAILINTPGTAEGNWQWRLTPNYLSEDLARSIRMLAETYSRIPKEELKEEPKEEPLE